MKKLSGLLVVLALVFAYVLSAGMVQKASAQNLPPYFCKPLSGSVTGCEGIAPTQFPGGAGPVVGKCYKETLVEGTGQAVYAEWPCNTLADPDTTTPGSSSNTADSCDPTVSGSKNCISYCDPEAKADADSECGQSYSCGSDATKKSGLCFKAYLNTIIKILGGAVGVIVTIMIIVGGIQYITAGGDPNGIAAAKKRIYNAILALVLFIFMGALLQFLVPGGIF